MLSSHIICKWLIICRLNRVVNGNGTCLTRFLFDLCARHAILGDGRRVPACYVSTLRAHHFIPDHLIATVDDLPRCAAHWNRQALWEARLGEGTLRERTPVDPLLGGC